MARTFAGRGMNACRRKMAKPVLFDGKNLQCVCSEVTDVKRQPVRREPNRVRMRAGLPHRIHTGAVKLQRLRPRARNAAGKERNSVYRAQTVAARIEHVVRSRQMRHDRLQILPGSNSCECSAPNQKRRQLARKTACTGALRQCVKKTPLLRQISNAPHRCFRRHTGVLSVFLKRKLEYTHTFSSARLSAEKQMDDYYSSVISAFESQ